MSLIKANCPNVFINPKKNEANRTDHGFHLPKINAAKAKNPRPATDPLNSFDVVTMTIAPPRPAINPEAAGEPYDKGKR